MTLKPMAETIPPRITHSRIEKKVLGVKNTRWIYTKRKLTIKITALLNKEELP